MTERIRFQVTQEHIDAALAEAEIRSLDLDGSMTPFTGELRCLRSGLLVRPIHPMGCAMKRPPCTTADGRGKMAFQTHSQAKRYARNLGIRFAGQKHRVYRCSEGCGQYHLASR